ncbi:hypothetical protein PV755_32225 [Streptomyces caniscabiei]|uniref:Uncharacterized protein n=1 Tax=Streptomyces caniscabiei TaxID=2746961 RepID=A0A927QNC7_9ACTN|nr:hypothetical protein [Streptomyces caniscabiei]MBD9727812.1 hypothetical protein [Streptomyces caniscabiei]MDX3513514.1 hypothetical protein [Streptomyces caniscabiei]MDX3722351.1 hypothetical protein [Streptomyces caniscabiei]WEO27375.1 hypothetical protein IHE65_31805 [Streptomyces caniscabiei]
MTDASRSMVLFVEDGRFEIDPTEPGADESPEIEPPLGEAVNGLVAVTHNAGEIRTGIRRGNVHLDVHLLDAEPADGKAGGDDWDEVVDTTFVSTTGYARISSYEHALDLNIAHQGPGTYRLRLHAKGRDSQPGAALRRRSKPTAERYEFLIWPAAAAPEVVHKATDTVGRELRVRLATMAERGAEWSLDDWVGPLTVKVTDGTFSLRDPDAETPPQSGGFLSTARDWALISTGTVSGTVTVTLHPADRDPRPDPLPWDEIAEATVRSTTGSLVLCTADGPTKDDEDVAFHGPRQYGVRVHARRTPHGEDYLVQTWMHGKR